MIITTIKTIEEKKEIEFPYYSISKDTGSLYACISENASIKVTPTNIEYYSIPIVAELEVNQKEFFDAFDKTMNFILLQLNK